MKLRLAAMLLLATVGMTLAAGTTATTADTVVLMRLFKPMEAINKNAASMKYFENSFIADAASALKIPADRWTRPNFECLWSLHCSHVFALLGLTQCNYVQTTGSLLSK